MPKNKMDQLLPEPDRFNILLEELTRLTEFIEKQGEGIDGLTQKKIDVDLTCSSP